MRPVSVPRSLRSAKTLSYEAASAAGLRHARVSASLVFFANGFVVASWLPHIPEVKERLGLAGPPLIGMTAELVGLRLALVTIVCGVLAVAVFAGVVGNNTTSRQERQPARRA